MRKHDLAVILHQGEFSNSPNDVIGKLISTRYNLFKNTVLFKVQLPDSSVVETTDASSIEILTRVTANMRLRERNCNISHPCALISTHIFPFCGMYVLMNDETKRVINLPWNQRDRLTVRNGWRIVCISSISKVR